MDLSSLYFWYLFSELAREVSLSSSGHVSPLSSKAWHKLWGLKIQARLKHLLLKVAWDSLPSQGNIGCFVPSVDIDAWVSRGFDSYLFRL
jgi:hypothetical protein